MVNNSGSNSLHHWNLGNDHCIDARRIRIMLSQKVKTGAIESMYREKEGPALKRVAKAQRCQNELFHSHANQKVP